MEWINRVNPSINIYAGQSRSEVDAVQKHKYLRFLLG